jgi:Pup amidohydrolase
MREPIFGPTVYGIEHEYSVTISVPGEITHEIVGACDEIGSFMDLGYEPRSSSMDHISNEHFTDALYSMGIFNNGTGMLSNGGRFYIDTSGPEYCTPETTTASEAVLRTFDGDKIVLNIFNYLKKNDVIESFQLNRKIVDHTRSSRGVHINTSTSLQREPDIELIEAFSTLNAAKGSLFGSGGLLLNQDGEKEFHHSPRLSLTDHNSFTVPQYDDRALVRHPFQDDVACRRIETITTDSLSFAWPLRASLVITNALVRLYETENYSGKLPFLYRPIDESHIVGRYGNSKKISIIDKDKIRRVYPAQILQKIAELALEADVEYENLDEESRQVLGEIIDTADEIKTDPAKVVQRVESIARFEHMKRLKEKYDVDWRSSVMCQRDYYWDMIGGGIAENIREKKGWGWYGFSTTDTSGNSMRKLSKPPKGTRAQVRGELIRATRGANESTWYDFYQLNEQDQNVAMHPLSTKL